MSLSLLKIAQMDWEGLTRIGATPECISPIRPSGDGTSGPAVHVEGSHLPIAPRSVPSFNRDVRAFPIGHGNLTPASLIRPHPSSVVIAGRDGEASLFQNRPVVVT